MKIVVILKFNGIMIRRKHYTDVFLEFGALKIMRVSCVKKIWMHICDYF